MVNIITLDDGKRYMVDVGFGGNGPTGPLLLEHGYQAPHIEPAQMRLVYENIAENTDPEQRLWIYQHRVDERAEWTGLYCFTTLEFLPQDYEIMNFWTSQSRGCWFTYRVVVVRMLMEGGELVGTDMLVGDEVKRRVRGEPKVVGRCATERERVEALEKWFGIVLSGEEVAGIRGMVTALPQ
ncbi:N-terminal acetyltransferase [Puttea exsequens]|nr:N-terminal acetyltransferase [Puttea exsequens]